LEESTSNLHNHDISGVASKPRPKTAKAKNEEENVFYRRQGPNNQGYLSNQKDDMMIVDN
jgi:hypothetical protein